MDGVLFITGGIVLGWGVIGAAKHIKLPRWLEFVGVLVAVFLILVGLVMTLSWFMGRSA